MDTKEALSLAYEIEGLLLLLDTVGADTDRLQRISALLREKSAELAALLNDSANDADHRNDAEVATEPISPTDVEAEEDAEAEAEDIVTEAEEEVEAESKATDAEAVTTGAEEEDEEEEEAEAAETEEEAEADVESDDEEIAAAAEYEEAEDADETPEFEVNITIEDNEPQTEPFVVSTPEVEIIPEVDIEPEPEHKVAAAPIHSDMRRALTLNDTFRFRRQLFNNSSDEYNRTLDHIAKIPTLAETEKYLLVDLGWDPEDEDVKEFMRIVRNTFNVHY